MVHEDPEHRIRFNNDDIRNMLGDYWVPNREKVVTATYNTVLAYGMVAVFLLDEVLKYNPDFDYHINREWTTTLIKDFDGEINYYVDDEDDAHIIGVGNVNFFTTQTGF
jgi:hypothetical protein